eukprot:5869164-Amphidinium_carterae.1
MQVHIDSQAHLRCLSRAVSYRLDIPPSTHHWLVGLNKGDATIPTSVWEGLKEWWPTRSRNGQGVPRIVLLESRGVEGSCFCEHWWPGSHPFQGLREHSMHHSRNVLQEAAYVLEQRLTSVAT